MRIQIDTTKDTVQDIRKAIALLQSFIGDDVKEPERQEATPAFRPQAMMQQQEQTMPMREHTSHVTHRQQESFFPQDDNSYPNTRREQQQRSMPRNMHDDIPMTHQYREQRPVANEQSAQDILSAADTDDDDDIMPYNTNPERREPYDGQAQSQEHERRKRQNDDFDVDFTSLQ